jgi:ketol-acid reductoisomerase
VAQVYHDRDADLKHLEGRTVAVVGYGNQGRAQALNRTDSGVAVMVGCLPDSYQETPVQDGLKVAGIAEAVQQSDIIMLLIPDEVQSDVYREHIEPHLKGACPLRLPAATTCGSRASCRQPTSM